MKFFVAVTNNAWFESLAAPARRGERRAAAAGRRKRNDAGATTPGFRLTVLSRRS
jgi:hypothetical protein